MNSGNSQLKTLLGSTKNPIDKMAKFGLYETSWLDYTKVYIGQTRRMEYENTFWRASEGNTNWRKRDHLKEAGLAKKSSDRQIKGSEIHLFHREGEIGETYKECKEIRCGPKFRICNTVILLAFQIG